MKYKYYDQRGRLLCEADSPITFNLTLYPIWKYIKCEIEEGEEEVIAARVTPTVEEKKEAEVNKAERVANKSTKTQQKQSSKSIKPSTVQSKYRGGKK